MWESIFQELYLLVDGCMLQYQKSLLKILGEVFAIDNI